jgi:hypothetical protein
MPASFAQLLPERFKQGLGVGNRLIEMYRRHVKFVSLPLPEHVGKVYALKQVGTAVARKWESSFRSMLPRLTSSAISRRAAGADATSRLVFTKSIGTSGRLAAYRRNS